MDGQVLGVGIIGCGRIFDLHMRGYQEREDAAVLAVADVSEERRAARQGEYGIPRAYADYREMLDDPSIQLVEILTPHHLHREMAIAAAEAGKHVSLQKPPALDLGEMDEITAAAEAAGVVLRVYENFVFYPPIVRAKMLIDEGAIGQPLNIRMRTLSGSAAGGWEVPLEAWAWRVDERTCGGGPFVFDDGYHKFSMALFLLGDVERVFCWMESLPLGEGLCVDAPSICIWKYKDANIFGSIDFTWAYDLYIKSDYYAADDRVEITGTEGVIWVTRGHGNMLDIPPLLLYREGKLTAFTDLETDWGASFRDSTRHLLDALREGTPPRLTPAEGRRVLQFALAAIASAREGRPVRLDDVT
ncbi:MAG: Gfo/Idh/MocA family oxidoreductase [Actinobacteria bacterium]|nr:Gfo/Idh/MocA family oxidoreductase [Actinomycetota bacterium]